MTVKERIETEVMGKKRHATFIIVAILNILLLAGAVLLYGKYSSAYSDRLWQENLGNIANLNQSAARNVSSLISNQDIKLRDIARYCERHSMTHDEALDYISDSNSSEDRYFELIGEDYTGYFARKNADGTYPAISYASDSYTTLRKSFDDVNDTRYSDVCFMPEFTDNGEKRVKVFAIYRHLTLTDSEGQPSVYTLILATEAKNMLAVFNTQSAYDGQSAVLIDGDGNYIISSTDFKSTNLFQYLYKYNDLTLDEKLAIEDEMAQNGSGELYYKNSGTVVEDCVFRYEKMKETNDWYCVTSVPLSSFREPVFNTRYIIYAVLLLALLLILDISWLQLTNRRLRLSVAREIEANAAKGRFMSLMSHEIRTPLNAIIGYNTLANNALTEAKDDIARRQSEMKVMDCLSKSDVASKHLLSVINDVLDMSAIESGKIKVAHDKFDFRSLVGSLTTIFYSQAKAKDVDFEVVFDTFIEEWFNGDQMRVNQVLTNLLANAVKFTSGGGTVKLLISQPKIDDEKAYIHFEVSDTGIGMAKEFMTNIWTPFEQADSSISRRFGGTGLGLSITKNLVDLMNGTITVESELGKGTTFKVDLAFDRVAQPDYPTEYNFKDVNALVVDDDRYTCDYIKQLFSHCGARCESEISGSDAIVSVANAIEQKKPYTVCLIDWRMPKMDGIETVKKIREIAGKDLPVIVLTAYDYSEITEAAQEAGVNMFISKPLFQSTLFDLLANTCGRSSPKKKKRNINYDFTGARVLLAEDNKMNLEIAQRILETTGLTVDCATNGKEAVEMFENAPTGTYNVILMDVRMPVMDGHEATKAIRNSSHAEAKTIPIIAMTADAFAENVAEAIAAGMNDHVSKPIDTHVLFDKLAEYIGKNNI